MVDACEQQPCETLRGTMQGKVATGRYVGLLRRVQICLFEILAVYAAPLAPLLGLGVNT